MILNIDFNPSIEEKIEIEKIILGEKNIIDNSIIYPGGTGFKLEWLLNIFNEKTFITGFLGMESEKYLKGLPEKSNHKFILIKDKICKRIIIQEGSIKTLIKSQDPRITKEEVTDFYNIYDTLLEENEYIVGFDKVPEGISDSIHEKLARIARIRKKRYIIEIKTQDNLPVLEEKPYMVIISKEMLEDISNLVLDTKQSIAAANNYILKKGIKGVFVNLYEDGIVYSSKKESHHIMGIKTKFSNRSNYGLIAGVLIGLIRGYDKDALLKLSHAYNISYNNNQIMDIRMKNIKQDMTDVVVEKIYLRN